MKDSTMHGRNKKAKCDSATAGDQGRAGWNKFIFQAAGAGMLLLLWYLASLKFPPMVVPTIPQVANCLLEILKDPETPGVIASTVSRLLWGLGIGIAAGSIIGLLCGKSDGADAFLTPFLSVMQSVPPVSWLVLALVWFGFNGRPTIFIVATATVPTMAISLKHGVRNVDGALLQMAQLYCFSERKKLLHIVIPSVRPYFYSGLEVAVGSGWKLCVMGEVLSTTTGIGGMIVKARQNIASEEILAWSVILVVFCWLSGKFLRIVLIRKGGRYAADTKPV